MLSLKRKEPEPEPELLERDYDIRCVHFNNRNIKIFQRQDDGYFLAHHICSAGDKIYEDYKTSQEAPDFIKSLETLIGKSAEEEENGYFCDLWIHPRLAVHVAYWVGAGLACGVMDWVLEFYEGQRLRRSRRKRTK